MAPKGTRRAPSAPPQPKPPGKGRQKATDRQDTNLDRKDACVTALLSSGGVDRAVADTTT
eukprot:8837064-Pyramimonas_sp.AAC.1